MKEKENWLYEITPKTSLLSFNFKELWRYRDLMFLFVKRDIITLYKQTVLGPLWYIIQPLLTSVIFTLIFNNIGDISTGQINSFLFNLGGVTAWNYFKECLTQTSDTFKKNQGIFGKVYFPRAIMPLSIVVSSLVKFGIQLLIFFGFYAYYVSKGMDVAIGIQALLLPILILFMGMIGLGLGMIISSMVTKYRDLSFLITFGVQLLMYVSAVVYPMSEVRDKLPDYYWVVEYNPLSRIMETFRAIVFGTSEVELINLVIIFIIALILFLLGLLVFNRTEKSFIDTV